MLETPIPSVASAGGLAHYLQNIRKFPMLAPEEEYALAKGWRDDGDTSVAHRLVTSHLRLVAKIAMGNRSYGLPVGELISEGNIGMIQAAKRFEPERGFRLATYAIWWIRAGIQEYILRSCSLVKIGTTAAQNKLFFNLRRLKAPLHAFEEGDLAPETVMETANQLNVPEADVVNMNRRLSSHDHSLNATIGDENGGEWMDWLVDDSINQEVEFSDLEELQLRRGLLGQAVDGLNQREQRIFNARRLDEKPITLEESIKEFGITRERVRQIEVRAFKKVQKAVTRGFAELQSRCVSTAHMAKAGIYGVSITLTGDHVAPLRN